MEDTVILGAARSALATAAARTAELIGSLPRSDVPIPGSAWSVREAAVHLVNCTTAYHESGPSPWTTFEKDRHSRVNADLIAEIPETDPAKLASLMAEATRGLLDATAECSGTEPVTSQPASPLDVRLVCVNLGEHLLHGYDMAIAARRPWPIDPGDAALVLYGYGPAYGLCLNPVTTAGLTTNYGIELHTGQRLIIRFVDGAYDLEPPDSGPVDCIISADPVAFLLVGTGRMDQWTAIALGLMTAGGSRPELALSFTDLFIYP